MPSYGLMVECFRCGTTGIVRRSDAGYSIQWTSGCPACARKVDPIFGHYWKEVLKGTVKMTVKKADLTGSGAPEGSKVSRARRTRETGSLFARRGRLRA